jgi:hypothetical protein
MDNTTTISIAAGENNIEARMLRIQTIKERIENMTKYHQIEVLRLLNKEDSVHKNENSNGTFINLTEQSESIILLLEKYTNYVDEQQKQFNKIEDDKEELRKDFF